jgi:hypothetical protein
MLQLLRAARWTPAALLTSALCWATVSPAGAVPLEGDLDGNGSVNAADETLLESLYGGVAGGALYDPAADLDGDGRIDFRDLAIFGAAWGQVGGTPDTTPPGLLVTLNDIPDDMNDLVVVPPSGFQITLHFDAQGGSLLDPASLSVSADRDIAGVAAAGELAGEFSVSPTRAVFEIPASGPVAVTNVELDVSVRDVAGNLVSSQYAFAVRPFAYGPPMGNPQTVFLDFDQDRSLGPEIDFLEDLREYGLSTSAAPAIESQMRDRLVGEIVERVYPYYGRNSDGSPGTDPVNVTFTAIDPGPPRARLCVGGESSFGGGFLGGTTLDVHNLDEDQDECGLSSQFGVFPQALDNLWGSSASFQSAFDPLDPGRGGVPVGADPLDALVIDPGFDPSANGAAAFARWVEIENAVDAFAQAIATAVAHEAGHGFGLVAHGAAPAGLFGGSTGAKTDHNVTATGSVPTQNYLMNQGSAFSFDEMTGRAGNPLPVFRPLNWAYLHDRVALSTQVTGLYPPPVVNAVVPNPVVYAGQNASVTFQGTGFLAVPGPPVITLATAGDPTPNAVLNVVVVDGQTVTGTLNKFQVPAAVYDVRFVNPDGQETTLVQGLTVQ